MSRVIIAISFLFIALPLFSQFSEDFESYNCNGSNATDWTFSGFSLSGSNAINGCSARSGQLSNPASALQLISPVLTISGSTTASFSYKVTNMSSGPQLEFILIDLNSYTETSLWSIAVANHNQVYTADVNFIANGNFQLKWAATGNQGGSRMMIDDIFVPAGQPLPVELTEFRGEYSGERLILTWYTESEVNFQGFEIQRINPNSLDILDFVPARGAGTYRYETGNPEPGNHYYRLKMIDFDQSFDFSPVINVYVPLNSDPRLEKWGQDQWVLTVGEEEVVDRLNVRVFSPSGMLVYKKVFEKDAFDRTEQMLSFSLPGIDRPSGMLFLHVEYNRNRLTTRFMNE